MKKTLVFLFLVLAFQVYAQDEAPKPDRWRGFVLNETTPETILEKLGKPKSDKKDKLYPLKYKWITKRIGEKIWRTLHYENIGDFNDVKLAFNESDKLVLIHLEPKKLTAQSIATAYEDVNLRHGDTVLTPADISRKLENDYPAKFGAWYELVGATKDVFVFAGVGNGIGSVGSFMGGGLVRGSGNRSLPGDVKMLQLISRTLENKDNLNLLK